MARTERGKHGQWLSTDHLQAWYLTGVDIVPFCARERTPVRAGEREVCMDQLLQSWNIERGPWSAPSGNWISGKAVMKFFLIVSWGV